MSDRLQNWNNWRYLPIGTKEREAWHELDSLYRKNKELEDRIKNVTFEFQGMEKLQRQRIDQLKKNASFFKCCALSGEVPEDGAEPYPEKSDA